MIRLPTLFTGLLMTAFIAGCTSNVNVDYDKAVNFSTLKTYTLLPKSAKSTDDTRLDSPLVDKRIVAAITHNMTLKGFTQSASNPDIQVKYQVDTKQEIVSDGSGVSMLFGTGSHRTGFGLAYSVPANDVQSYDRGVLTIDFISANSGQLVWRGTSSRRLYDASTPDSSEKLINSIVTEILEAYPPK
jgi:hypothetical protein